MNGSGDPRGVEPYPASPPEIPGIAVAVTHQLGYTAGQS
jgi:hypothetical protein